MNYYIPSVGKLNPGKESAILDRVFSVIEDSAWIARKLRTLGLF